MHDNKNKVDFDEIKTLKAAECQDGSWMLEGSYYHVKVIESHMSFYLIAEFKSLEECKLFCDLNLPSLRLHVVSFKQWLQFYWLGK